MLLITISDSDCYYLFNNLSISFLINTPTKVIQIVKNVVQSIIMLFVVSIILILMFIIL